MDFIGSSDVEGASSRQHNMFSETDSYDRLHEFDNFLGRVERVESPYLLSSNMSSHAMNNSTRSAAVERNTVDASSNAVTMRTAQTENSNIGYPSPTKLAVDDSSAYESVIFTLVVGPQKRVFTAHLDILAKSPFFRAACQGSFREATSRTFQLEDDDPSLIRNLLSFLYTGDWEPRILSGAPVHVADEDVRTAEFSNQARLYCLAEKYDVSRMKDSAIRKMEIFSPIPLESLVSIAEEVYANLPPSDNDFRLLFRTEAVKAPEFCDADMEPFLLEAVRNGGLLAQDIFLALRDLCDDVNSRASACEHCLHCVPTPEVRPKRRRVKSTTERGSEAANRYR